MVSELHLFMGILKSPRIRSCPFNTSASAKRLEKSLKKSATVRWFFLLGGGRYRVMMWYVTEPEVTFSKIYSKERKFLVGYVFKMRSLL